ncbi:hypothetical protein BV898_19762 [Hypsibius exemplaris]|uniref:Uncharacterized protein n=1 Tax=Hypsibius exemplaris TaxID=2072580 RepID=A0A9X6NM11_HYPEX|nr:hypothetical protein BV898_19762 [Hypsibius exemplaris]
MSRLPGSAGTAKQEAIAGVDLRPIPQSDWGQAGTLTVIPNQYNVLCSVATPGTFGTTFPPGQQQVLNRKTKLIPKETFRAGESYLNSTGKQVSLNSREATPKREFHSTSPPEQVSFWGEEM